MARGRIEANSGRLRGPQGPPPVTPGAAITGGARRRAPVSSSSLEYRVSIQTRLLRQTSIRLCGHAAAALAGHHAGVHPAGRAGGRAGGRSVGAAGLTRTKPSLQLRASLPQLLAGIVRAMTVERHERCRPQPGGWPS